MSCDDAESGSAVGCMDPDAENYDPQATESGDCIYARDKFIAEYLGSFQCPGLLGFISSDSLSFTIQEGLGDSKDEVIVSLINIAGGLTFDLPATADGDQLNIEAELLGIPVDGFTGDVNGSGTATLSSNGEELTADITMTVSVPTLMLNTTETCTLVGNKVN